MKAFTDFRFHNLKEDDCEHKACFRAVQAVPLCSGLPLLSASPPLLHLTFIFCSYLKILDLLLVFSLSEIFIPLAMFGTLYIPNKWKNVFFLLTIKPCRSIARYVKWSCILWKKHTGIACSLISLTCWIFFLYNFKHYSPSEEGTWANLKGLKRKGFSHRPIR